MTKKIFISYSRHDEREAQRLRDVLKLIGYQVWFDQASLRIGENWWHEILSGIREAEVVILVVSRAWLNADACKAERSYALETNRRVLVVLTDHASPGILPPDLAPLQAGQITEVEQIKAAIDATESPSLPDPLPEPPPMPLGWPTVETAVRTHEQLDADIQNSIAGFLINKAREPDLKQRRLARRLAGEVLNRADLAQSIRVILLDMFGPGQTAVFPVVGATLGGLALTHLLWVTSFYDYLDNVLDQLVGFERGPARGVLTVNLVLGAIGVVLCAVAVRKRVRTGKIGLVLCIVAIVGAVLDSLIKVKWPIAW